MKTRRMAAALALWLLCSCAGQTLLAQRQFPEAVGAFREAISLFPDHANGYLGLAQAHFRQGDPWKAAETGTQLDPSSGAGQSLLPDLRRQR